MLELLKTGHGDDLCNMLLKDWLGGSIMLHQSGCFSF